MCSIGKSWSTCLLGLGLVLGWLSSCSAAAGHSFPVRQLSKRSDSDSESDIPEVYKISCGIWTCDGRTQFCSEVTGFHKCESCATDMCALAKGKDDFYVQEQCHAVCPVYYEDKYCEKFAAKCFQATPSTPVPQSTAAAPDWPKIVEDRDQTITSQKVAIIVMAFVIVAALVAVAVLATMLYREKRKKTPPQPKEMMTFPTEPRPTDDPESGPGTNDSGIAARSHQTSPHGSTDNNLPGSIHPTDTTTDGGSPRVDLTEDIPDTERPGATTNRSTAQRRQEALCPTQVARNGTESGNGYYNDGVLFTQPQCQASSGGKNLNHVGKDVPEPGHHTNQAAHSMGSLAEHSVAARYPGQRVQEGQPHSYPQPRLGLGPCKLDTDSSTTPLLQAASNEETSVKRV